MKALCLVLVALAVSVSSALMQAYSVEPRTASESGWTPLYGNVSEIVTCNWDELDSATGGYVELFVGENGGNGTYSIEIMDGATRVAYHLGRAKWRDHDWLRFGNIQMEQGQSFTKGKTYEFKFTRSGIDSIEYYYQTGDPYEYGRIKLGGSFGPTDRDLCMRVYGLLDPIDSNFWGMNVWSCTVPSVC